MCSGRRLLRWPHQSGMACIQPSEYSSTPVGCKHIQKLPPAAFQGTGREQVQEALKGCAFCCGHSVPSLASPCEVYPLRAQKKARAASMRSESSPSLATTNKGPLHPHMLRHHLWEQKAGWAEFGEGQAFSRKGVFLSAKKKKKHSQVKFLCHPGRR